MIKRGFLILGLAICVLSPASSSYSQSISFTQVPEGYQTESIPLPRGFAGGLGVHPDLPHILYASVGDYGDNDIVEVNLLDGSTRTVITGAFGSANGIVPLSSTALVIVDNAGAGADPANEGIFLALDNNPRDGDFDDPGEVTELIEPILDGGDFSGSQARLVPAGHPSLPAGSVLIQTADGGGLAEMLAVSDPLGSPAFIPSASAFFTGFDYNGGFDFGPDERVFMGTATGSFAGLVYTLDDLHADGRIETGESHVLVDATGLPFGIADLSIDREGDVFCAAGSSVVAFSIPSDPMTGTVVPDTFAQTDAGFLSGLLVTGKRGAFEPGAAGDTAALVTGGWTGGFVPAANLLVLRPSGSAGGTPYIGRVVSTTAGGGQDPEFDDPQYVIGPPYSYDTIGIGGSTHVYNLGNGGSITVEFTGKVIYDGPGPDFTVFENPFYISGSFDQVFVELGRVAVSSDGINWATFPADYVAPEPPPAYDADPDHYVGFAGVHPVFSAPGNGIDPLDPSVSGGDPFDLSEIAVGAAAAGVDLFNIRYIRITDVIAGTEDDDGDLIPETNVVGQNGFDLDSIAGLNLRVPDNYTAVSPSNWGAYE